MSSVSVDTPTPSQVDLDMKAAYEGGGNFMARLQELSDRKAQHDEALAALNLGKSAREAFAEANVKHSEAAGKLAEADVLLEQARLSAAETLAKAKQEADALLAVLKRKIADLHDAIDRVKAS